ncbi:MAG TPA: PQQ-binding-like beta-propeller repeat protein [Thermoguttaceae bacterium]|nr:PQQ-binding-like beta-propeller repeat protein [Thermoguttaceae bacterium]
MEKQQWHRMLASVAVVLSASSLSAKIDKATIAERGVKGGLLVHLGCGDGKLTAELGRSEGFLVCGLERSQAKVDAARKNVQGLGLYGKRVSISRWEGERLPFVDSLVNLLVVEEGAEPARAEILRVLAPKGVAYIKSGGKVERIVKPRPSAMDEWTHYLHGPDNNAVSSDRLVGPPNRLRWSAEPVWPRSHEYSPSLSSLVSGDGKIFYLHDDGIRGILDERLPERWFVYARDAYNGLLLWRVPLPNWGPAAWKHSRHWHTPLTLPRRLVISGKRVYVTLGYRAPVSVLDADTGATLRTFENTADTDEILCVGSTLIVRRRETIPNYAAGAEAWNVHVRAKAGKKAPKGLTRLPDVENKPQSIMAIDTGTGQLRWRVDCGKMMTLSLAATAEYVCYHDFDQVVCLRFRDGKELWRAASASWPDLIGTSGTLLLHNGAVYFAGTGGLQAWDAATGAELWQGPRIARTTIRHPPDMFIADGLLWGGLTPDMPTGRIPHEEAPEIAPAMRGKLVQGLDPKTGKVAREWPIAALISPGHHVRCYRAKATDRYLMWPKRGIEFVDIVNGKDHQRCNWVRGECSYGLLPANGLIYAPPHPCQCSLGVVLTGFNALASAPGALTPAAAGRLLRGPAYGERATALVDTGPDWPMYRRDGARSGRTTASVPTQLKTRWTRSLGGKLTPPVIATGQVYVASPETHVLHALDSVTGEARWQFTAGARIDSPPTVHRGFVVFGCRDGRVYCLRAEDGALVWRFSAGPQERRIVAMGQLESPWAVSGSVLVEKGAAYFAAGRSSFLDGGVYLYGLAVPTGEVLYEHRFQGPAPDTANTPGPTYHMEGTKADLLSTDGKSILMLFQRFDMELNKLPTPPGDGAGNRRITRRLAPRNGFLDTTWFDRTSWTYGERWLGRHFRSGTPASGQILVFDDSTTYTLQVFSKQYFMSPSFTPGAGYLLRADPYGDAAKGQGRGKPKWAVRIPVRARGMVLAGDTLFLAGAPDTVAEEDPYAALEGRKGAVLWAVSAQNGRKLAEEPLGAPTVPDGMAAARGRLFLCTIDGEVLCLGEQE